MKFEERFEFTKEFFKDKSALDVSLDGSMGIETYMLLKINPKKGKFILETVSTVTQSLEVDTTSSADRTYEEVKDLMRKKTVF